MADKKITALTELTSTGKVSSTDLLHIIDYSASPVNKKITVSNLLKDATRLEQSGSKRATSHADVSFALETGAVQA